MFNTLQNANIYQFGNNRFDIYLKYVYKGVNLHMYLQINSIQFIEFIHFV